MAASVAPAKSCAPNQLQRRIERRVRTMTTSAAAASSFSRAGAPPMNRPAVALRATSKTPVGSPNQMRARITPGTIPTRVVATARIEKKSAACKYKRPTPCARAKGNGTGSKKGTRRSPQRPTHMAPWWSKRSVTVTPLGYTGPMPGYAIHKPRVQSRLRRIEGQVRGIAKMVDEDRYCIDVLTQVSAVKAALESVALLLLADHTEHCVAEAILAGDGDAKVKELNSAVQRLVRA